MRGDAPKVKAPDDRSSTEGDSYASPKPDSTLHSVGQILRQHKEKEVIELPPLPTPPNFKWWRNTVRKAVAAASADPDTAFTWIKEVEKTDISFDELHESGQYRTLDAKLAAAISVILKGDFGKTIQCARRKVRGDRQDCERTSDVTEDLPAFSLVACRRFII